MIFARHRLPGVPLVEHLDYGWSVSESPRVQAGPAHVPADGRVEVIWSPGGIVIGGHVTSPVVIEDDWNGPIHGVQLKLGRAAGVLGADPGMLVTQHTWLEDVWGREAALLHERVAQARTAREAVAELVRGIDSRVSPPAADPMVELVATRAGEHGSSIAGMARESGYSERQLRRRFTAAAGYGPKMLLRIERFQRFLKAPGDDLARTAAELGYSDESHLGRDARELAGLSPAQVLEQRRPDPRGPNVSVSS